MNKAKGRTIRLTISEESYDEYKILGIRAKKGEHDLMVDVLEKYIDKRKDKASSTELA